MADSILGDIAGSLGSVVKKTGEDIVKLPKDLAEAAAEQGNVKQPFDSAQGGQAISPARNASASVAGGDKQGEATSGDKSATQDVVKGLYEKSDNAKKPGSSFSQAPQPQSEFEKEIADKTPEEQKKLRELRDKLHKETYYDSLVSPPQRQEERPAEKVENEKKQEMQDLQKKEAEKPPPLAVQKAQRKTEMFPGSGG